jgi:hypothetical protein
VIEMLATLIFLHAPDGHEVRIAPEQITSMHSPGHLRGPHFPEKAQCAVYLTDGKLAAVVETCEEIQKMLERIK